MSDERFSEDAADEPELSGVRHGLPASTLSDRDNTAIHYALQEFFQRMSEHEVSIGRELTAGEKFRHIWRFESALRRQYGAARPDAEWVARHDGWCSRHGGA
jgi:hypothetical protein